MITKVDVTNGQGALLSLSLDDPSSGYLIEDISGLGPVKATIVTSSFAGVDGEPQQSTRRDGRDLTFKINFEPDYVTQTVWDLRQRLYGWFMTKAKVSLRFWMATGLYVDVDGTVETFDPEIFTDEPNATLTIRCPKPDFVDPNTVTFAGNTVATTVASTINYAGSTDTGILFTLNVDRALTEFSIFCTPSDGVTRKLTFISSLLAGDVVKIQTIRGSKFVTLTRGTVNSSMLYAISPDSEWIELMQGPNQFRVYAVGAAIPYTVSYTSKYGGL
jgi:hypothetical protein